MKLFVSILALTLLFAACQKDNDKDAPALGGLYSGTFNRTGMDTSNVSLDFSANLFEGTSDQAKYPAICNGSFEANESTIVFTDSCSWTADFDWSLILNGTYNLSYQDDNRIRIWKTNGTVTDEYLLRKVVR
jgi:hypothetical protein